MEIAIIGAGLAGLATTWFLLGLGCKVTFYDAKDIGQGASGQAAGLLHPYVGEQVRRSLWANEAIEATKALLLSTEPGALLEEGIIRIAQNQEQKEALDSYQDVEFLGGDRFLIHSGIVIDAALYLQGLYHGCIVKGASFKRKEVTNLEDLNEFNQIVIAAGHKIEQLIPQFRNGFSKIKGQILRVRFAEKVPSTIAKGYLAKTSQEGIYHWGSTYERKYLDEEADPLAALALLRKKSFPFTHSSTVDFKLFPLESSNSLSSIDILDCRAGIRLTRHGHYLPFVDQIKDGLWCFGALGSRGLLYHAFLGKKLAEAIFRRDKNLIPKECRGAG